MCQLSYINLHNESFNKLLTMILLQNNSRITNKDGHGFYQIGAKDVFKDIRPPSSLLNLSNEFVKNNKNPIMAHVRLASATNKKLVAKEYCHPFKKDNIVLAHNGTLECSNELYADPNKIDSQIFLDVLSDNFKEKKDMVNAIEESYKDFSGKFAFLINNTETKESWAVRGKTAELNISYIGLSTNKYDKNNKLIVTPIGYAINTVDLDLAFSLLQFQNLLYYYKKHILYTTPASLDENSIFKLNDFDVEKVGTVKETFVTKAYNQSTAITTTQHSSINNNTNITIKKPDDKIVDSLLNHYINLLHVDFQYLDYLCYALNNKGILQLSINEIDRLMTYLDAKNDYKVTREWNKVVNKSMNRLSYLEIHEMTGLEFPYFINNYLDIREAGRSLVKIFEASTIL